MYPGPHIVNEGLLYALDAASPKSYPGSGATWFNLASNTDNADLDNSPTFNNSGIKNIETDGTDEEIFIPGGDDSNLNFGNTDSFSIETWCNLQAMPDSGNTLGVVVKAYRCGIDIYFPDIDNMVFRCGVRNTEQAIVGQVSTNVALDEWNNVIFTYEPSSSTGVKLYINGALNTSISNIGQDDFSNNSNYTVGGNEACAGTPKFANLQTAIIRMYGKTLNADEVLQNYNATKPRFI